MKENFLPCHDGSPCGGIECNVHEDCPVVDYKGRRKIPPRNPVERPRYAEDDTRDARYARTLVIALVVVAAIFFWIGFVSGSESAGRKAYYEGQKVEQTHLEAKIQELEEANAELKLMLETR